MKRIITVFILLAAAMQWAVAQESTVYLRNGSIAIGRYAKSRTSDRARVVTPNGSTIFFTENAIRKVVEGNDLQGQPGRNTSRLKDATVYLQNESVIKGKLDDSQERMSVETPNGTIIYFSERSVLNIETEGSQPAQSQQQAQVQQQTRPQQRDYQAQQQQAQPQTQPTRSGYGDTAEEASAVPDSPYKTSGYAGFIDVGYTVGMGDISTSRFEITTSHGYLINPYFFLGIGVGVNLYSSDGLYYNPAAPAKALELDTINMSTAIPVFADFRVNFLDKGSVIPFAGIKAGYTIGFFDRESSSASATESSKKTETKMEGVGFYLQPSVGVKFKFGFSTALNLSVGYSVQTFDHYYIVDDVAYKKTKNNGGVLIRAGFEF